MVFITPFLQLMETVMFADISSFLSFFSLMFFFGMMKEGTKAKFLENTILGQIFGPKRDKSESEKSSKIDDFHHLYHSSNIVMVILIYKIKMHVNRVGKGPCAGLHSIF